MTGSWQAEAVLATACIVAAAMTVTRGVAGRCVAAALAMLAVAAVMGGLLFAGVAPGLGAAHDVASRVFATLGFALVLAVLIGLIDARAWRAGWAALVVGGVTALGLVVPLAPVVLVGHAVAAWGGRARMANGVAALAMAAVIVGQVAVPAGAARLDTLHLTLAAWALCLAAVVATDRASAPRRPLR